MRARRWLLALLSVLLLVVVAPPARAACHAFTVSVTPAAVEEGDTVRITVSRDAGVNPSSIDVSTIDESARAGSDYTAINETVSFSTETTRTLTLTTTDDAATEPAESLRVHLSNPGGCAVNPNFSVGPDARVTIKASDAPGTTLSPSTTLGSPRTTTADDYPDGNTTPPASTVEETTTSKAADTDTTAPDAREGSETTDTTTEITAVAGSASDDGGGGAPIGVLAAAAVVLAGAVGGGVWLLRRRSA